MNEQIKKKDSMKIKELVIIAIVVIIVVIFSASLIVKITSKKSEPEIITKANLEKIIKVSDLSTFEAVYNGIAKAMNEKKSEECDYYVSYDAKVKAGIDFEKVDISIDNEKKIIIVKLPKIKITDVNVDITSLDYIFINDKANTSTVSEEAYKKCIEDVEKEIDSENEIYELAKQNAHNIVEALINPFVEQLDSEFKLEIDDDKGSDKNEKKH